MNELATTKNSKNVEVAAILKAANITVSATPVIIDIRPTKTAGKSTIFCIAEVQLGVEAETGDINRMSAFELIGQQFTVGNLMRGKMTMSNDVITANKLVKGSKLELIDPASGELLTSCLRAYESRKPFYDNQQCVGFKNDANVFTPKLKDNKQFYRDSKVVSGVEPAHQLL